MDVMKFPALEKVDVGKKMAANKDYLGARSRLLEVHYQFPNLRNLPQMITACDILSAADLTLPDGQFDWYWVLQLGPAATLSQIRLQHKKLVALLEGIVDTFPGAITALKLVHDALFVLSNPPKCVVFNSKRLISWSDIEPYVSPVSSVDNAGSHGGKSLIYDQDTSLGCESSVLRNTDDGNDTGAAGESSLKPLELEAPHKLPQDEEDAVVTALDVYQSDDAENSSDLNFISCPLKPICSEDQSPEDTVASAMPLVVSTDKSSPLLSDTSEHGRNEGFDDVNGDKKSKMFEVGQIWAVYDSENYPRRYVRINSFSESPFRLDVTWLQPVPETENEVKWCEAGLPVVCGLFNLQGKEEIVVSPSIFSHSVSYTASPTYDEFRIYPQEDEIWAIYKDWRPFEWIENPECRKGCSLRVIQILYSKEEERVLVAQPVQFDGSQNIFPGSTEETQETIDIPERCFYRFSHRLPSSELRDTYSSSIPLSPQSLPLHDSKGSSLKLEWTARDFTSGQVWAIYDGPDQMPRRYAIVNNVLSDKMVGITLLEPHPIHEDEICWIEENLPPGCGIFKVSAASVGLQMSKFSHMVSCDRSTKQMFYRIYPKKGEVWAMYRNWNSKWKRHDFENSRCRIVQITSDFCEQSGVQVASLEEVSGYRTFFQKQLCDGFALNRAVRRSEMLSFSHRVEAYVVPGIQAHGIPECSWHLEPDALPLILSN